MKIKKLILICISILLLSGCTNINNLSYDDILDTFTHNSKNANKTRSGYKYYLPSDMNVINYGSYYEIIKSNKNYYYLYVDMISYINESENTYKVNKDAVYSKLIENNGKYGYLEINLVENNQYLIEIMYNYAKIEVMVDSNLLNEALIYSVNILNSVEYNNSVINSLLNKDALNYTEEEFDLFKTGVDNKSTIDYIEEEPDNTDEDSIIDTDYVD
jgi:hypothetical protein